MMENAQYVLKKFAYLSFFRKTEQKKLILWTFHCQNMTGRNMESVMRLQWRKWQWLIRITRWVISFPLLSC